MPACYRIIPFGFRLASMILCGANIVAGATHDPADGKARRALDIEITAGAPLAVPEKSPTTYKWNVSDKELPLLGLPEGHLTPGLDHSLSYPLDRFNFPIFQVLSYDAERSIYVLPSFSAEGMSGHIIEFAADKKNTYLSNDGSNIQLIDRDTLKTVRAGDGTSYLFVRYPDGEFRCASIKTPNAESLSLLYSATGLMLHGVIDSTGRTITFDYSKNGIESLTQTWMANSRGQSRTWAVGDQAASFSAGTVKYSHALNFAAKVVPGNATVHEYTPEMEMSDKMLARIFGGPQAIAAANGFEPAGLATEYPLYRGDTVGDDGIQRRGHLSSAMHLYGSPDGKSISPLYVPSGFTQHSDQPSPTDAVVLFYYPKLGNLKDVTLAVFHVADFQISYEGERVRIGNIGGPGGSSSAYKHSHIEFYRGNTSLPSPSARARLRIDPARVFSPEPDGR